MKNLVTISILIALILMATLRGDAQVISRFALSSSPLTTAAHHESNSNHSLVIVKK